MSYYLFVGSAAASVALWLYGITEIRSLRERISKLENKETTNFLNGEKERSGVRLLWEGLSKENKDLQEKVVLLQKQMDSIPKRRVIKPGEKPPYRGLRARFRPSKCEEKDYTQYDSSARPYQTSSPPTAPTGTSSTSVPLTGPSWYIADR